MKTKAVVAVLSAMMILAVGVRANTISLPGSYEQSSSDVIVLGYPDSQKTINYNVGILQGNDIDFNVRYSNFDALNTPFGDTVNTGGFKLYAGSSMISEIAGITNTVFDQATVRVSHLVDNGMLGLRLTLMDGSDPLAFYRPWLYVTDTIPPSTTTDLAVIQSFPTALRIQWTASGDDGLTRNAAMYEIRFSKWPVGADTNQWWGYAEQASGAPEPETPGAAQNFVVERLDTLSTYYLILATYDEVGNRSAYSNVASGNTGEGGGPPPGINFCLDFNGINSRAVIPNTDILNPTQAITIETWMYCRNYQHNTQGFILGKCLPQYQYPFLEYALAVNSGNQEYACITTSDEVWHKLDTGPIRLPVNQWTHLSFTYNGSELVLYVDGQFNQSAPVNGPIVTWPYDIYLGILQYLNGWGFDGKLDELRIWSIARTPAQIQQTMNLRLRGDEPGLVGYWNFDEGAGQVFRDITSYGSNGFIGSFPDEDPNDPLWAESDSPVNEFGTGTNPENDNLPRDVKLGQNFPNPFNAETVISFNLPKESPVRLEVYDMLGRKVITLADGILEAGAHAFTWDGRTENREPLSSGLYFYRLKTDSFDQTLKMMMLK